jgi:hypothetical protein
MLFLLFGSSAAGKTVALPALRRRVPALAVHDFDEIDVPADADTAWRQRANERWVRRGIEYQADGVDLLLAGQTPLGELLATPSARLLEAISGCLLDCDDETRVARLHARGREWLDRVPDDLQDFLSWAEWMRGHARDPRWRPHVIRQGELAGEMHWERWSDWQAGDPRWRVRMIDTSELTVEHVVDALALWVDEERALFRTGLHPLAGTLEGFEA